MRHQATAVVALNYVAWGLLPLFWNLLEHVNATYLLGNRIVWASVFSGLWLAVILFRSSRYSKASSVRATLSIRLVFSAVIISLNWWIYIWAVNSGYVSYAALGYFIAPLLSVLLGFVFFNEQISPRQWIAIALTAGGALVYGWGHAGVGLLVVLGVGATFSVYGAIKKTVSIGAVPGLFAESALLAPIALVLILTHVVTPGGQLGGWSWVLLACSGIVTLVPLVVLSHYAQLIPLSVLGMLQFILPVVQLGLGIGAFGESVTAVQVGALAGILAGVCLYLFGAQHER